MLVWKVGSDACPRPKVAERLNVAQILCSDSSSGFPAIPVGFVAEGTVQDEPLVIPGIAPHFSTNLEPIDKRVVLTRRVSVAPSGA